MPTQDLIAKPLLEADRVSYSYPGSDYGMPPISFRVEPGDFVHIEGQSGSGKSTLARCLTGVIPHLYHGEMHGEVRIDGQATTLRPLWALAEQAGMITQNPAAQMLAASVDKEIIFGLENLGCSPGEIDARLADALEHFGLIDLRDRSPRSLSGGEQQKLALAAIMARQPPILVLDEPLSMLDITAATMLIDHLKRLSATGTAIVIFEHRGDYLREIPGLRRLALDSASREKNLSPQAEPIAFRPSANTARLTVDHLTVEISGRAVIRDLSFKAHSGETVAIVGRNGVGKTTLMRALAGLQPFDGLVEVDGGRPDFGMVFQNPDLQIFNATVRDEILYRVPNPDMDHYQHVLDALDLSPYEAWPPLLLSEGEKKRVALATVLVRQPRHGVLLDEPSLGQDQRHKNILIRLARALNQAGQMVLLTTHDLTLAAQCDRIILLGADGIAADCPRPEAAHLGDRWEQIGFRLPGWALGTFAGSAQA